MSRIKSVKRCSKCCHLEASLSVPMLFLLSVCHGSPHICPFIRIKVKSSLSLESTAVCSHICVFTRGSVITGSPDDVIHLKAKRAAIFNRKTSQIISKMLIIHLNSEINSRQHHSCCLVFRIRGDMDLDLKRATISFCFSALDH